MKQSQKALFASLIAATLATTLLTGPIIAAPPNKPSHAAAPAQPAINPDARAAVEAMGKTLQGQAYSMQMRTIRVTDQNGDWIHVFHTSKLIVRRPDRLLAVRTGDDAQSQLIYDGNTLVVTVEDGRKYASIPVPGTIEGMLHEAIGKLGIDFPVADLLTDDPAKAVMSGVTAGGEVGTTTIDGIECRHLLLFQPGIEVELWVEKNDRAVPRRLIVSYRSLQGAPEIIAEFSGWNFDVHPADADFVYQPPAGAVKVALRPANATGSKR
jgi:hypothetical protein